MWIICQWVITVWVRPSTRVGWHNWTIKSSTVSLAHLVLETSLCSWLGWLKSIRERKWIFYQVGLLAFDMMCIWAQVSVGNFQDKRYCMHEVHSTLFKGHSQGYRKQTTGDANQRHKNLLARRKDAQALFVAGPQPASGNHDKRTSPTNLQPPTAPAIGSGGNKLSLRCCRCSQSRHATGIQKQNLTDQEKGVVSSLSVCEKPDFFKTRWWTKNFFCWKLAQGPSQHLDRDKKLHTAFSFCTSILTADQVFPLVFWTHAQCTERLIVFVAS